MKRKKLLLINPGSPWFFYMTPPLALGYVAAVTPKHWDIEIIDEKTRFRDFTSKAADLVGITVMTPQALRAYRIAEMFTSRGIPVVFGGIHVSMLPDEAAQYGTSVVVGEAETVWPEVIRDYETGNMAKIYKNDHLTDLENLPVPPRKLFSQYYPWDIIKTTRGCPFNCDFCSIASFNSATYRLRPIDGVIEELKQIRKRIIFFADDNIIGSGKAEHDERAMALFDGMIRANIRKSWGSQASVQVVNNPELLRLMRKSGCRILLVGFESLEESELKGRGKYHNLAARGNEAYYRSIVDKLHKYGIAVNGFFLNAPSESRETIFKMGDYLAQSDIDLVTHTCLTPFPGTRLYEKVEKDLCYQNFPQDWAKYDFSRLLIKPSQMTEKEFYLHRHDMVKKTHAWKRILRLVFQGLFTLKSPIVALYILIANYSQRKAYHKELPRNLKELASEKM